jgi:hypothetical protein
MITPARSRVHAVVGVPEVDASGRLEEGVERVRWLGAGVWEVDAVLGVLWACTVRLQAGCRAA